MGKKRNMKPIVIIVNVDQTHLPNKMHFETQLSQRSHTFIDRKKRAKNGYRKYKKRYDED